MEIRYLSIQILTKEDGSLKAQRIYAIPKPVVVSQYAIGHHYDGSVVIVGLLYQQWNGQHDIIECHPDYECLRKVIKGHFGLLDVSFYKG